MDFYSLLIPPPFPYFTNLQSKKGGHIAADRSIPAKYLAENWQTFSRNWTEDKCKPFSVQRTN